MGASRFQMRNELRELKYQMTEMVSKMSSMDVKLELYKSRIHACEYEITQRREDCMSLRRELRRLRHEMFCREQHSLRNDLNIINVPENNSLSLVKLVVKVARMFKVPLEERDIVWAERVGCVRNGNGREQPPPRPIVVRLAHSAHRIALLFAARFNLQDPNCLIAVNRLYINERLTRRNQLLLQKTRLIGRHAGWHQVWISNGKIYVRCSANDPNRYHIRHFRDLFELCAESSQLRSVFFRDVCNNDETDSN